jgi:hypothetical protein
MTRIGGTVINSGRLAGPESTINLDQLSIRRLRPPGTTFSDRRLEEQYADAGLLDFLDYSTGWARQLPRENPGLPPGPVVAATPPGPLAPN